MKKRLVSIAVAIAFFVAGGVVQRQIDTVYADGWSGLVYSVNGIFGDSNGNVDVNSVGGNTVNSAVPTNADFAQYVQDTEDIATIDAKLTGLTATASQVVAGYTFVGEGGEQMVGSMENGDPLYFVLEGGLRSVASDNWGSGLRCMPFAGTATIKWMAYSGSGSIQIWKNGTSIYSSSSSSGTYSFAVEKDDEIKESGFAGNNLLIVTEEGGTGRYFESTGNNSGPNGQQQGGHITHMPYDYIGFAIFESADSGAPFELYVNNTLVKKVTSGGYTSLGHANFPIITGSEGDDIRFWTRDRRVRMVFIERKS